MDEFFAEMAKYPLRIFFLALVLLFTITLLFWQPLMGFLGWRSIPIGSQNKKLSEEQIREIHENLRVVSSTTPKLTPAEIQAIQKKLEESRENNPDAYSYSDRGIEQLQHNLQEVTP